MVIIFSERVSQQVKFISVVLHFSLVKFFNFCHFSYKFVKEFIHILLHIILLLNIVVAMLFVQL